MKRPLSGWWRLWLVSTLPIALFALSWFFEHTDAPYLDTGPCPLTDNELVEQDIAIAERAGSEIAAYRERISDVPPLFRSSTAEAEIRANVALQFPEHRPCTAAENAMRQNAYALRTALYPIGMTLWIALCLVAPILVFAVLRWIWRGFSHYKEP